MPKISQINQKNTQISLIISRIRFSRRAWSKFTFFSRKYSKNQLISAENLKFRWKSTKWRKLALYFEKSLNYADNLNFTSKSRFSTNCQRNWGYFRVKNSKIVCHDPQFRSIFLIFLIRFHFTRKPTSESWRSKYEAKIPNIRWMCSHISVISLSFCSELVHAIIIN